MEYRDEARPAVCPICGREHPLRYHGWYLRWACESESDWQQVKILRYLCPGCERTVGILPEFLTPYKRYTLREISRVFYLRFVFGMSFFLIYRSLLSAAVSTIRSWIRDWAYTIKHLILKGFVEAGIISGDERPPGSDTLEWAFIMCERYSQREGVCCIAVNCEKYVSGEDYEICEHQRCRGILPTAQLRLQGLSPPLWPLRNI